MLPDEITSLLFGGSVCVLDTHKLVFFVHSVLSQGAVPVGERLRGASDERSVRWDTVAVIMYVQSSGGLPPRAQTEEEVGGEREENSVKRSQVQTIPMY